MLTLKVISPEKVLFDGEVKSVKVPGTSGEFEILNDHAPIISTLEEGTVSYTTDEGTVDVAITGGFAEVKRNEVSLCVEMAE